MPDRETVSVRYMVDDVDASIAFYTQHLGFDVLTSASPAFADVQRDFDSGNPHVAGFPLNVRVSLTTRVVREKKTARNVVAYPSQTRFPVLTRE